jgi:uncharacterized protein YjbJ (UPF0337 family)
VKTSRRAKKQVEGKIQKGVGNVGDRADKQNRDVRTGRR